MCTTLKTLNVFFHIFQTLDGDRILNSDCLAPYNDDLLCSHLFYP